MTYATRKEEVSDCWVYKHQVQLEVYREIKDMSFDEEQV
jgi:hypothetical protein